jgi:apolipoprotein N-acyltransferase
MKQTFKTYGPTVLSGVALALTFPAWGLYPLAWVALVPLFWRVQTFGPRASFGHFFLSGWLFNSLVLQWLVTNIYWAGGWAIFGYQILCVTLALFWGVTGLTWWWIRGRVPRVYGGLCLAVLWIVMEYLQGHVGTGFGWCAIAYGQGRDPYVLQLAALGGTALIAAALILCNALMALAISEKGKWRIIRIAVALVVVAASHGVGALLLGEPDYRTQPFHVGIIQADFSNEMKWDREYTEEMVRNIAGKSQRLARMEKVDLFVWPEAAIMTEITTPGINRIVTELTKGTGIPLFTGSERVDKKTGRSPNSSWLINGQGEIVDYYDKVHLVPFGEYVPFASYIPFLKSVVPAMGEVGFGEKLKVLPADGRKFGPLICFEVLFADLSEDLRRQGAEFLVVITNLAWFGQSDAIPQELELGRLRAVETRLPLVHCANTGISGVFDPWGRFTPINAVIDSQGRYGKVTRDFPPEDLIMQRAVGALPVALPALRPIPYGPPSLPWVAMVLTVLLLGYATFLSWREYHKRH